MSEVLKWGTNEYRAGDRLVTPLDHRVITILDIYADIVNPANISVVLEIGDDFQTMMDSEEFAYRVDNWHFTRLLAPLYAAGSKFTHTANNDTLEIIAISEREDWNGEYKYFVKMVDDTAKVSYTAVNEAYLGRCLNFTDANAGTIALPEIKADAVFPSTTLV